MTRSLDLSGNRLQRLLGSPFPSPSRLESLHLSRNPLLALDGENLRGLGGLRTLGLAYVPGRGATVDPEAFRCRTPLRSDGFLQ